MKLGCLLLLTLPLAAQDVSPREPLPLTLKRAVALAISPEGSARVQLSGEALKQAESRSRQARASSCPISKAPSAIQARHAISRPSALTCRLQFWDSNFQRW
jgi:hypothetical protein